MASDDSHSVVLSSLRCADDEIELEGNDISSGEDLTDRLCVRCRFLDFEYVGFHDSPDYGSNSYFITREYAAVQHSAQKCDFCSRIVTIIDDWKARHRLVSHFEVLDFDRASVDIRLETDWHDVKTPTQTLRQHAHIDRVRISCSIPGAHDPKTTKQLTFFLQRLPSSNDTNQTNTFMGRSRPLLADLQLLKRWKSMCEIHHSEQCRPIFKVSNRVLPRVIDAEQRCLVDAQDSDRWVCLSYVWGKAKTLTLVEDNIQKLYKPGALSADLLPNIVEDAIQVTLGLGERFLWVDALCIIQNSNDDKSRFITRMDAIYSLATVVLVAATCIDANSCLPGVKAETRSCMPEPLYIRDVPLIQCLDPVDGVDIDLRNGRSVGYLGTTIWDTRAWTLQERFLATRCLVFTSEQIYWECEGGFYREDGFREIPEILPDPLRTSLCGGELNIVWQEDGPTFDQYYRKLLEEYSRRAMSHESDGLNAFSGVVRALEVSIKDKQDFFWGMPTAYLESAFAWGNNSASLCRRQGRFPSWSWCGWVDPEHVKIQNQYLYMEPLGLQFFKVNDGEDHPTQMKQRMSPKLEHDLLSEGSDIPRRKNRTTNISFEQSAISRLPLSDLSVYFWTASAVLEVTRIPTNRDQTGSQNNSTLATTVSQGGKSVLVSWSQMPRIGNLDQIEVIAVAQNRGDWDGGHVDNGAIGLMAISRSGQLAFREGFAWMAIRDWCSLRNRRWDLIVLG